MTSGWEGFVVACDIGLGFRVCLDPEKPYVFED